MPYKMYPLLSTCTYLDSTIRADSRGVQDAKLYVAFAANGSNYLGSSTYHDLNSSKDEWLHDLSVIAEHGFLVLGIDNIGHGERRYPDFEERFAQSSPNYWREFVKAVYETADEVPQLVDALMLNGLATKGRVGILGVSTGGFVAHSAILIETRLSAVVTIVSSPEWWGLESSQSPHHHIEEFSEIKLLSQTGGQDYIVSNRYTYTFHAKLKAHYNDYEMRFAHYNYPASDHMMNPDWEACWQRAIEWFERHLTGT